MIYNGANTNFMSGVSYMHILIIDDHPLYREILAQHLEGVFSSESVVSVFEAVSAEEALGILEYQCFDLVLLDIGLPGLSGVAALPLILMKCPDVHVVMMSGIYDAKTVQAMIAEGGRGYISKTAGSREFENAIKLIRSGEIFISPSVISKQEKGKRELPSNKTTALSELTPKQKEVFMLMSQGYQNKIIASKLNCTEGTIKLHVSAILQRLQVKNRTEAVMKAATVS